MASSTTTPGATLPVYNEEDILNFQDQLQQTVGLLQAFLELQGVKTEE